MLVFCDDLVADVHEAQGKVTQLPTISADVPIFCSHACRPATRRNRVQPRAHCCSSCHLHTRDCPLRHACHLQAKKRNKVLAFYTIPEYEAWREAEGAVGWDIKYYKGAAAHRDQGA